MAYVIDDAYCQKFLINEIRKLEPGMEDAFIVANSRVLEFNEQGKRDRDFLGLQEDGVMVKMVRNAGINLLGEPFFSRDPQLSREDLDRTRFVRFTRRVRRRFNLIIDDYAWLAVTEALGAEPKLTDTFPGLEADKTEAFLNAVAENINKLVPQATARQGADLENILEQPRRKRTYQDLVHRLSSHIHDMLGERLKVIGQNGYF